MGTKLVITADGSATLYDMQRDEPYHSLNGAIRESRHVFIGKGLLALPVSLKRIRIFEMGLGTGLNLLMTVLEQHKINVPIEYTAVETDPPEAALIRELNYPLMLGCPRELLFKIHSSPWNRSVKLHEDFILTKLNQLMTGIHLDPESFDLVYYDAFSPEVQPELWRTELFSKLFHSLSKGGVLVTYSAKGAVRRSLIEAGFSVERIPGPPGKREMLRAWR
jgi:tRNA U34 5-methylaminomethyl-2-thiouridine-forming methyltransferase MnmC